MFSTSVPLNTWGETVLEMRRISSGGSCPMYHFLFSFPRARAAPRQASECITVMVTMALWKASVLASGPVPRTSHFIHYCPMTVVVSTPLTQNQPISDDMERLALAKNVAHSLVLSGSSKSQCRPLCLRWDLFRRCSAGGCAVVFKCTFGCVKH